MKLFKKDGVYDLDTLTKEKNYIESIYSYKNGFKGCSISLLGKDMLEEPFVSIPHNSPYTGVLFECPYIKKIFSEFKTKIIVMRLLRLGPHSSHLLHFDKSRQVITDKKVVDKIARFQIPIVTNNKCSLCITKYKTFKDIGGRNKQNTNFSSLAEFLKHPKFQGKSLFFSLNPGFLYYFDTSNIHTMFNDSNEERVTLTFDLLKNSWLENWMKRNLFEVKLG